MDVPQGTFTENTHEIFDDLTEQIKNFYFTEKCFSVDVPTVSRDHVLLGIYYS